jgi:nitrogen regulatory protein PII
MKMVMIVFRDALTEQVMALLQERAVKAYTLFPEVSGVGSTGAATGSFSSLGLNSMVLVALPEEQADQVVGQLKVFHDTLANEHPSGKVPVHVFTLPCTQVV